MKTVQFWIIAMSLLGALILVHIRGNVDQVPASAPLNQFPIELGSWSGQDLPINAETREVLGKGDFLNRFYTREPDKPASTAPVQLFIGYFPTQRTGQSIHSPQNCLPGSGWTFLRSGVTDFTDDSGKQFRVGDYVISDGRYKQEVLYWYQSHGRSIASDYSAKFHMLVDAIRLGRTDAALVRVITPIQMQENEQQAHARLIGFAKSVTPLLPAYVPN